MNGQAFSAFPRSHPIGELSRSFNHEETGTDEDAVLDLCDCLEYAERTGDGDLDIMW